MCQKCGNKHCKHEEQCELNETLGQEFQVTFPGDKCSKKPDFVIAGAGMAGLPLAYKLTNQGYRVLVIDAGEYYRQAATGPSGATANCPFPNIIAGDPTVYPTAPNDVGLTCTELEIKYPFKVQPFNGFENVGIINAVLDPKFSTFLGNPSGLGSAFQALQALTATGVGGGGLHF